MAGNIARWTTPTVTYKPSQAEVQTIEEIYLAISQGGTMLIRKGIDEAEKLEDGFSWTFEQEETALLANHRTVSIQVDYKCYNGMRCTTMPRQYNIINSAINEVI